MFQELFRQCGSRSAVIAAAGMFSVVFAAGQAQAGVVSPYVLTIDITNPTAVVITGTGAAALVSRSGLNESIRLDDVLTAGGQNFGNFAASTTLGTGAGGLVYTAANRISNGTSLQLGHPGGQTQTFVAGQPAFTGAMTIDLSFLPFRPAGTVRNIYVLGSTNSSETGVVVGQVQIVPAPGAGAAGLMGLGLLAARRRRR